MEFSAFLVVALPTFLFLLRRFRTFLRILSKLEEKANMKSTTTSACLYPVVIHQHTSEASVDILDSFAAGPEYQ